MSETLVCSGLFPGKSGKIRKHRGYEVAVMRVGRREAGRVEIEDVTGLGHRLGPRDGRRGEDLDFDNALLITQQLRVGFDFGDHATDRLRRSRDG